MHLGNGAITSECVALTISAASAGLGLCAWSARRSLIRCVSEGKSAILASLTLRASMAAALGTFVFAAQAVNVPILPTSSAHLVGGVLLAWALGPAVGGLTMALVLALQALLLGDGGTVALGANVVNMALVPAGLVALARRAKCLSADNLQAASRELAVVAVLSAAAVMLAAGLIVVEVALFRTAGELAGWSAFAQQMLSVHLLIALVEGAATAALAAALVWFASSSTVRSPQYRPALIAAALAAIVALAIPLSSELPDGYESAAAASGMAGWLE